MEPIINPIVFYWMNISEWVHGVAISFAIISTMSFATSFIVYLYNKYSETEYISKGDHYSSEAKNSNQYKKTSKKICIASFILLTLFWLAAIFVPPKNVLIEMLIAKNITTDNLNAATTLIKDTTDYVVQSIKSLY